MPLEVFIVTARRAEQNKIIQINLTGLKIPTDTAVRGGLELGETDLQVQRFNRSASLSLSQLKVITTSFEKK